MAHVIALINTNVAWLWDAFVGTTLRTSLLLSIVILALPCWKRSSSAQRHLIWSLACAGILGIPLLQLIVPVRDIPILPATFTSTSSPERQKTVVTSNTASAISGLASPIPASTPAPKTSGPIAIAFPGITALLSIWAIGLLYMTIRAWNTRRRINQMVATSIPVGNRQILDTVDHVRRELGVGRTVLVRYQHLEIPFVHGTIRPVILLPFSVETWDAGRLRDVIVHEVAHVKRWDGLSQAFMSIVCAIYWFNPLVWIAIRSLRHEREGACDDYVLALGTKPSDYATHLLEFTNSIRKKATLLPSALAFAYPTKIQKRLHAIIDPDRRRSPLTGFDYLRTCGVAACVVFSLLAFAPVPRSYPPKQRELFVAESLDMMARQHNEPTHLSDVPPVNTPTHSPMNSTAKLKRIAIPAMMVGMMQAFTPNDSAAQEVMTSVSVRKPLPANGIVAVGDSLADTPTRTPVRRLSSIQQAKEPLVVVNGYIVDGRIVETLNANEIVKVDVLRGEAAIKKYGAAAEGGVIEITTGVRKVDSATSKNARKIQSSSQTPPAQRLSELVNNGVVISQGDTISTAAPEPPITRISDLLKGTVSPAPAEK